MKDTPLDSVSTLVQHVSDARDDGFFLYRGQSVAAPLLPKVARTDPSYDSTEAERRLLDELRMRGSMLLESGLDDWDLLCIAQHHGAATRLLDWTTNPLVALWMALQDKPSPGSDSVYVYTFEVDPKWMLPAKRRPKPFDIPRTRVLQPPLNNERVAAQAGWFTAHKFNKAPKSPTSSGFVPLEKQRDYGARVNRFVIPLAKRGPLLIDLHKLGVNAQTMFPGIEGLCRHMSWRHECEADRDSLWFLR